MKVIDLREKSQTEIMIEFAKLQANNLVLEKELERLNSIIKEAREYIEHENFKRNILVGVSTKKYTRDILNKLLEILDKVEKENDIEFDVLKALNTDLDDDVEMG